MKLKFQVNSLTICNSVLLSPCQTKKDLIKKDLSWEEWIRNDNEVVSYRIVLIDKKISPKSF